RPRRSARPSSLLAWVRGTRRSIDDLDAGVMDPRAHPGGLHHNPSRASRAAAATDDLTHVVLRDAEGEQHAAFVVDLLDLDGVRVVDQLAREEAEEILHVLRHVLRHVLWHVLWHVSCEAF